MRFATLLPGLLGLAVAFPIAAWATPNLVQNGSFEQATITANSQFGPAYGNQGVTDWYVASSVAYDAYWNPATASTVSAANQWNDSGNKLTKQFGTTASQDGGNFISLDGDPSVQGVISQSISGLTAGQTYQLSFDWAAAQLQNRTGTTTEQLEASLGAQNAFTNVVTNPSQGFSGWMTQSFNFTATGATETLAFMSLGTPSGLPPIALLDGVTLTAVPEPASLTVLGVAMLGLAGTVTLRRRRAANTRVPPAA